MATVVEVDRDTVALVVGFLQVDIEAPCLGPTASLEALIDDLKTGRVRIVRGTDQTWRELGLTQSPPREPYRKHPTTTGG